MDYWKLCTFPGECTQTRQRAVAAGDCTKFTKYFHHYYYDDVVQTKIMGMPSGIPCIYYKKPLMARSQCLSSAVHNHNILTVVAPL